MGTEAIDWHETLQQIKSTLEGSAPLVEGVEISYFIGQLDVTEDFCPLVVLWSGGAGFEQINLGKDATTGRLAYREFKTIYLLIACYKVAKGTEDSIQANAHAQLEDLQKVVLDAVTQDTTLGGNVMTSRLVNLVKDPPEALLDQNSQVSRLEIQATKNWYS